MNDAGVRKEPEQRSTAKDRTWRAAYLLGVFAFLLPFVSVKGCDSSDFVEYRGHQLMGEDGGWLFIVPICIGLALFAVSFVKRRVGPTLEGFLKSWKTLLAAAAAGIVMFCPSYLFFFDTVRPKIGQLLGGACWSGVYLVSMIVAFRHVYRARRAPAALGSGKPGGFFMLRVFQYLLGLLVLVVPFAPLILEEHSYDYLGLAVVGVCLFSIPVVLVLYSAVQGLGTGDRWAVMWSFLLSLIILAGGAVSTVLAIRETDLWLLAVTLPVSCLAAAGFLSAIPAIRERRA
jgi:hypothetical protein